MTDLEPYRPVSYLPAVTRDLSVAVSVDDDAEQLGDRIRTALGDRADILEAVTILSQTSYTDLPLVARERLGINAAQKNVLVRLDLRPLDRTLADAEANGLRDEVYEAIHKGSTGQWAGR
jgi:phenylalanyl-tRNA synthetase alpha chain